MPTTLRLLSSGLMRLRFSLWATGGLLFALASASYFVGATYGAGAPVPPPVRSDAVAEKVKQLGGSVESIKRGDWGAAAFCADPFGHGFCLIELESSVAG